MKQKITARGLLAQVENDFFKGVNLDEACQLKGDERRAFRLSQVERLLTEKHGMISLATWLSDFFWKADEGRVPSDENANPLLSPKGQQTLTSQQMDCLRLMMEISGLCHDLSQHFTFDLKEAFGVRKNDFWVSNKHLVEWLTSTEYERIAMHTAYIMKKRAISVYECGHYLPAQDELAELYSSKHNQRLGYPDNTEVPSRDYVSAILDSLLAIERHWQRGRRLKLSPDLVILHDEIYGVVPRQFDKGVLKAAQEIYDYMGREVYGRFVQKDNDTISKVLRAFATKVREVRSQYLAKGWLADDSLEFGYLLSHAERCGYGQWCEEDDAL